MSTAQVRAGTVERLFDRFDNELFDVPAEAYELPSPYERAQTKPDRHVRRGTRPLRGGLRRRGCLSQRWATHV